MGGAHRCALPLKFCKWYILSLYLESLLQNINTELELMEREHEYLRVKHSAVCSCF